MRFRPLFLPQREFDKAKPLYKRALAIQERALGPDHPGLAKTLNKLALFFYKQVRVLCICLIEMYLNLVRDYELLEVWSLIPTIPLERGEINAGTGYERAAIGRSRHMLRVGSPSRGDIAQHLGASAGEPNGRRAIQRLSTDAGRKCERAGLGDLCHCIAC